MQMTLFDLPTPFMPVLDVKRCYTRPVNHLTAAKMVEEFHYAHRVPSIVLAVGMYVDDTLAGVCCYGIPANNNLMDLCGKEHHSAVLELNRLFIHEWAGKNSESWLIGQSFNYLEQVRKDIKILVSYADIAQGHAGMIYRATNWIYTGISDPGGAFTEAVINGKRLSNKNISNIYGTREREKLKAIDPNMTIKEKTFKHRYVMLLGDKRQKRMLLAKLKYPVLPYPKAVCRP